MLCSWTIPIPNTAPVAPLILCLHCKAGLFLIGIEPERPVRDVFTLECPKCHRLEARGVAVHRSSDVV